MHLPFSTSLSLVSITQTVTLLADALQTTRCLVGPGDSGGQQATDPQSQPRGVQKARPPSGTAEPFPDV